MRRARRYGQAAAVSSAITHDSVGAADASRVATSGVAVAGARVARFQAVDHRLALRLARHPILDAGAARHRRRRRVAHHPMLSTQLVPVVRRSRCRSSRHARVLPPASPAPVVRHAPPCCRPCQSSRRAPPCCRRPHRSRAAGGAGRPATPRRAAARPHRSRCRRRCRSCRRAPPCCRRGAGRPAAPRRAAARRPGPTVLPRAARAAAMPPSCRRSYPPRRPGRCRALPPIDPAPGAAGPDRVAGAAAGAAAPTVLPIPAGRMQARVPEVFVRPLAGPDVEPAVRVRRPTTNASRGIFERLISDLLAHQNRSAQESQQYHVATP